MAAGDTTLPPLAPLHRVEAETEFSPWLRVAKALGPTSGNLNTGPAGLFLPPLHLS